MHCVESDPIDSIAEPSLNKDSFTNLIPSARYPPSNHAAKFSIAGSSSTLSILRNLRLSSLYFPSQSVFISANGVLIQCINSCAKSPAINNGLSASLIWSNTFDLPLLIVIVLPFVQAVSTQSSKTTLILTPVLAFAILEKTIFIDSNLILTAI